jgi:hypothetical protein
VLSDPTGSDLIALQVSTLAQQCNGGCFCLSAAERSRCNRTEQISDAMRKPKHLHRKLETDATVLSSSSCGVALFMSIRRVFVQAYQRLIELSLLHTPLDCNAK